MADVKDHTATSEEARLNEHESWFYTRDAPQIAPETLDLLVNYSKWDSSEIVPKVQTLVSDITTFDAISRRNIILTGPELILMRCLERKSLASSPLPMYRNVPVP